MSVKNQPISEERIIKTVYPSIAAFTLGRWIGRTWEKAVAKGPLVCFAVGLLLAPLAVLAYLWRLRPGWLRRYVVTDRRVAVLQGILPKEAASVSWEEIDRIEAQPQPGQSSLRAADVVLFGKNGPVLVLPGVPLAENFVRLCRRTHQVYKDIQKLRHRAAS